MNLISPIKRKLYSFRSPALKSFAFFLSRLTRTILKKALPPFTVKKHISSFGPYYLDQEFLFSDFSSWSTKHNAGFDKLITTARSSQCVFDIGAHIGLTTLPLSQAVGPNGLVFAFEPSPKNFSFLSRHVVINDLSNVKAFDVLLGDKHQESVEFFEYEKVSGMNSLADLQRSGSWTPISCPMTTVDAITESQQVAPNLLKIDVEGAESAILAGAVLTLQRFRPTIFLSVHPRQLLALGSSVDELRHLVQTLGYEFLDLETGLPLRDADPLSLCEYMVKPLEK